MRRLRVGVSLLYVSPARVGGAGIYASGVVRALVERGRYEYVLFVPPVHASFWSEQLGSQRAEMVKVGPDPDRLIRRVLYEQTVLPRLARRYGVDVMFFPHTLAPVWRLPPCVVTVHDLLALSGHPIAFSRLKRLYLRWTYRQLRKRAAHVVTVSEFCRNDIATKLGLPLDRISVVTNAVDEIFLNAGGGGGPAPDGLPGEYVLSVASALPHKRLFTVLEAFEIVARDHPALHLVYAGVHAGGGDGLDRLRERVARSDVGTRVRFLSYLPRAQFPALYARAAALMCASEFEGFGIPIAEAMAMGCPVAASPALAVVEVLGGNGWLAVDFSASALAEALRKALTGRHEAASRLQEAQARARGNFTWENGARALEDVCEKVVDEVRVADGRSADRAHKSAHGV